MSTRFKRSIVLAAAIALTAPFLLAPPQAEAGAQLGACTQTAFAVFAANGGSVGTQIGSDSSAVTVTPGQQLFVDIQENFTTQLKQYKFGGMWRSWGGSWMAIEALGGTDTSKWEYWDSSYADHAVGAITQHFGNTTRGTFTFESDNNATTLSYPTAGSGIVESWFIVQAPTTAGRYELTWWQNAVGTVGCTINIQVDITVPSVPSAPVLYPSDGANQIAFNNIGQSTTTPIIRASATYTSTFNRFQVEFNTASDFSGTAYTQTFSGTYSSATAYNLQTTATLGLPTTNGATYYVRARASPDGGTNYSPWSSGSWSYTYQSSGDPKWTQTADGQFDADTLTYVQTDPPNNRVKLLGYSPFLYVYQNGAYAYLSDFLGGATAPERSRTDLIDLTGRVQAVNGQIKLKITEEMDETTYLDRVYLLVDGRTISAENGPAALAKADGQYLVMQKGDEHYLAFAVPPDFHKIEFAAQGYYLLSSPATGQLATGQSNRPNDGQGNGLLVIVLIVGAVTVVTLFGLKGKLKKIGRRTLIVIVISAIILPPWLVPPKAQAGGATAPACNQTAFAVFADNGGSVGAQIGSDNSPVTIYPGDRLFVAIQENFTTQLSQYPFGGKWRSWGGTFAAIASQGSSNATQWVYWNSDYADLTANAIPTHFGNTTRGTFDFESNYTGTALKYPAGGTGIIESWFVVQAPNAAGRYELQWYSTTNLTSCGTITITVDITDALPTAGTVMSPPVDYTWVPGAVKWGQASWGADQTGGTVAMQVYYKSAADCDTRVPDSAIAGNSTGISASPIDLSNLNTTTYGRICLKATLGSSGGQTPYLNDWSVTWNTSAVTSLADDTNPGNATIGPGGSRTAVDAFTMSVSAGSDTISSFTVALATNTTSSIHLIEVTNSDGSVTYGSATDPTSNSPTVAVTGLTLGTSSSSLRIYITPKTATAMPPPPGQTYSVTATIADWSGTNTAHSGSDGGSATLTVDNLSPDNVTNATSTPDDGQATINWTNPASDFAHVIVARATSTPNTGTPTEGTTPNIGAAIGNGIVIYNSNGGSTNSTGLTNGTTYYYKIWAADSYDNYSQNGAEVSATPFLPTVSCNTNITATSFNSLATSSVATAATNASTTMTCTYAAGCTLNVNDQGNGTSPGLNRTTAPSHLIPSNTATLLAGVEGYGIQAALTGTGSGGTLTLNPTYAKTGNDVGGLSRNTTVLASSTGAVANREVIVTHKAAISTVTYAGDYTDTITYSCTGN